MKQKLQSELQSAFCNQHNDYMIEIVCLDFSDQECYRMCRQCKKEMLNIEEKHLNEKYRILQENFEKVFFQLDRSTIESHMKIKLENYVTQFTKKLSRELNKVPEQFSETLNKLNRLKDELSKEQSFEKYKTTQKFQKLKEEFFQKYQQIKQSVKDIMYSQITEIEDSIFNTQYLLNETQTEFHENQMILTNLDTYLLFQKFQQLYLNKYQFLNEEQLIQHKQHKMEKIQEIKRDYDKILFNCDKIINEISDQMTSQIQTIISRVKNCKAIFEKNLNELVAWMNQWENSSNQNGKLEIQDLKLAYFKNQFQFDKFEEILEQQAKEQLVAQKRLSHIGQIDVSISFEEIQQSFCLNFIPILINQTTKEALLPQLNFLDTRQEITPTIDKQQNQNLDFSLIDNQEDQQILLYKNQIKEEKGNIIVNNIIKFKNTSLFKLDLSKYFQKNTFTYSLITNKHKKELYQEENKRWKFEQINKNQKIYTLILNLSDQKIIFKDIKVNGKGQIDQNTIVNQENFSKPPQSDEKFLSYTGTLNNQLKFHGKGKLLRDNLIKTGDWVNGQLYGQGVIQKLTNSNQAKTIYEGQFINDKFHGLGKAYYLDGYFYEGEFANGLREGKGKIRKFTQLGIQDIETAKWKQDFPVSDRCLIF